MLPFRKILFPVDFSERCAAAAPTASEYASKHGGSLTLLHLVEGDETNEAARARFKKFAIENHLCGAEQVVADGDPATEIVWWADHIPADLIFMPTHGYGPLRRLWLGSVIGDVLKRAKCPVWTNAHTDGAASGDSDRTKIILCAVDLKGNSRPVLDFAYQLASAEHAEVRIVHAAPLPNPVCAEYACAGWQEELVDDSKRQIALLQECAHTAAPVDIEIGDASSVVCASAREEHADLLVIGRTEDESFLGRLGAHADSIIRHSPCPVISVW